MADHKKALDGILTITALTPLHPGAGSGYGLIDNPIIRERPTGFPFLQAPSLKGVLRQKGRDIEFETKKLVTLFGPERSAAHGDHHEGALIINDGRILAMPIRSVKGLYVWITSPTVLSRFFRDFHFCGGKIKMTKNETEEEFDVLKWMEKQYGFQSLIPTNAGGRIVHNNCLYLEEFEIQAKEKNEMKAIAKFLAPKFYKGNEYLKNMLEHQLVLLNDDLFGYFIEHATQVEANIAIDQEKGTTVDGSLRYTEFLPMETLLYASYRISGKNFSKEKNQIPKDVFEEFIKDVSELQIGADETTGKGFVQLSQILAEA